MRNILFAALLLGSTTVMADRVDDMKAKDVEMYCYTVAQVFHDGTDFHSIGAARQVKNISRAEWEVNVAEGKEAPLDGIYYIDFDAYTDNEKAYITDNVYAGWDFAEKFPSEEDILKGTKIWEQKCQTEMLQHQNDKRTDASLIRAASNEQLYRHSPNSPQAEYCTDISVRRFNECMSGVLVK